MLSRFKPSACHHPTHYHPTTHNPTTNHYSAPNHPSDHTAAHQPDNHPSTPDRYLWHKVTAEDCWRNRGQVIEGGSEDFECLEDFLINNS